LNSVVDVEPKRIRWAVETLAVEPGDRLLEIGGGPGVAASLVCPRLDRGSLLLIDRSATAIERTRRRNPEHVASGRLALKTVDVADVDPGKARFDKAYAVNVNVFWTTPATDELARIHRALKHDGRLFLFYETPSAQSSGRRARGPCATGERFRRAAARLPLRNPCRVRGPSSLTGRARHGAFMEPSGPRANGAPPTQRRVRLRRGYAS